MICALVVVLLVCVAGEVDQALLARRYFRELSKVDYYYESEVNDANAVNGLEELKELLPFDGQTIPTEIGMLTAITKLDLGSEGMTGAIPTELGLLTSLSRLFLGGNMLSGTIPTELGNLVALTQLKLWGNRLSGTIPTELGRLTLLGDLQLYANELTGGIPSELEKIPSLYLMYLDRNRLNGTIPSELGAIVSMEIFSASSNRLTGTIPSTIGKWSSLSHFQIAHNQLNGTVESIRALKKLSELELTSNQFTGPIGEQLVQLTTLVDFQISNNKFTGSIPDGWGNFVDMFSFDIRNNQFTGTIPSTLGKWKFADFVDFSGNKLSGNIPLNLRQLSKLSHLSFSNNQFKSIPAVIFNDVTKLTHLGLGNLSNAGDPLPFKNLAKLTKLEELDISFTTLSSSHDLQDIITAFPELNVVNVSGNPSMYGWVRQSDVNSLRAFDILQTRIYNTNYLVPGLRPALSGLRMFEGWANQRFSDSIPTEIGMASALTKLDLSHGGLKGSIPSELGQLGILKELHLVNNDLSGSIPWELGCLPKLETLDLSGNMLTGYPSGDAGTAPRDLIVSDAREDGFTVSWETPVILFGFDRYNISYVVSVSKDDLSSGEDLFTVTNKNVATVVNRASNETYVVKVRMESNGELGGWSEPILATTNPPCPANHEQLFTADGTPTCTYICPATMVSVVRNCHTIGVTLESLELGPGFWRIGPKSTDVRACDPPQFCIPSSTLEASSPSTLYCSPHHVGPLCSRCENETFAVKSNVCTICSEEQLSHDRSVAIALWTLVCMVLLLPSIYLLYKTFSSSQAEGRIRGMLMKSFQISRKVLDSLLVYGRILLGFFQVFLQFGFATGYLDTGTSNWVSLFVELNVGIIFDLLDIGCQMSWDFYRSLLSYTITPIVAVLLMSIIVFGIAKKCKRERFTFVRARFAWLFLQICFLIYPGVSSTILRTFLYDEMPHFQGDEKPYVALREDPGIDFESDESKLFQIYAAFMIIVYPFGIVALFWATSRYYRYHHQRNHEKEDRKMLDAISFISDPYCPRFFWFESYELLRKLCQTSLFILISQANFKVGVVTFALMAVLFLVLLLKMHPYKSLQHQQFAEISLTLIIVVGFLGVLETTIQPGKVTTMMLGAVAILEVVFFLVFVYVLIKGAKRRESGSHASDGDDEKTEQQPTAMNDENEETNSHLRSSFIDETSAEESKVAQV